MSKYEKDEGPRNSLWLLAFAGGFPTSLFGDDSSTPGIYLDCRKSSRINRPQFLLFARECVEFVFSYSPSRGKWRARSNGGNPHEPMLLLDLFVTTILINPQMSTTALPEAERVSRETRSNCYPGGYVLPQQRQGNFVENLVSS